MVIYFVFLTISAATYALFSLGLNLQWGVTGLINFGHVAFMAIGAYSTVLLSMQGMPIPLAALIGAGLAALLGLLIGFSTLRLREDYLGIVTIGVSELVRLVAKNEAWLTKGTFGVQGYPIPFTCGTEYSLKSLSIICPDNSQPEYAVKLLLIIWLTVICGIALWRLWLWMRVEMSRLLGGLVASIFVLTVNICGALSLYTYDPLAGLMLLTLTTLMVVYIGLEKLVHSPWGRVLKAIREDEEVPRALGKNIFWYKLQAFMLGGAIAGISGAFYAWQFSMFPDNFEPLVTFNAWIIIMLGGAGNNLGTVIGAVIFWGYYELTRSWLFKTIFHDWFHLDDTQQGAFRIMVIGMILMLLMVLRPQGILGKKEELTLGR
jgi:neutral amino acid transport system permease protein